MVFTDYSIIKENYEINVELRKSRTPIIGWIVIGLLSSLAINGALGLAQQDLLKRFHEDITLNNLLSYYPWVLLVVLVVIIIDLRWILFSTKLIITQSEIQFHQLFLTISYKVTSYDKNNYVIIVEGTEKKLLTNYPVMKKKIFMIKMDDVDSTFTLKKFTTKHIAPILEFLLLLQNYGLSLDPAVHQVFQLPEECFKDDIPLVAREKAEILETYQENKLQERLARGRGVTLGQLPQKLSQGLREKNLSVVKEQDQNSLLLTENAHYYLNIFILFVIVETGFELWLLAPHL